MIAPYLSIPREQVADRLDEMIQAANEGVFVVITHDGLAQAQLRRVNPLMTEAGHNAIEELKRFPGIPYTCLLYTSIIDWIVWKPLPSGSELGLSSVQTRCFW